MPNHMAMGQKGEQIAQEFLVKQNYSILETNWRFNKGEIDIIVEKEGVVIFVEVKTRSNKAFGSPEESVSKAKQHKLSETATEYLEHVDHTGEFRFDIIAVLVHNNGKLDIEHFTDAFFPNDIE